MENFEPSRDFAARTMESIRSYEMALAGDSKRTDAGLLSRAALAALSAGGTLLGIMNLARMVWMLVAPAACL